MAIWTKILVFCLLFFTGAVFSPHQRGPSSLMGAGLVLAMNSVQAIDSGYVVINEIAWMGTETSASDEWIELYNNTNKDINLKGWGLYEGGGETLVESLTGIIKAKSYYLVERTDDNTIPNIPASQKPSGWGGHGLKNTGEHLQLKDNSGAVTDEINCLNGWFSGDNKTKQTMERKDSLVSGNSPDNWQTSQAPGGTPKAKNSLGSKKLSGIRPRDSENIVPEIEEKTEKEETLTNPSETKFSEVAPPKTPPKTSEIEGKKELASIKESALRGQTPQSTSLSGKPLNFFFILLIGLITAFFSGVFILFLKKKFEKRKLL